MTKVAIIILNWNGWFDTINCLESVLKLENDEFGVFVCDNASSDESTARIRYWARETLPILSRERTLSGRQPFAFREFMADADHLPDADWPPHNGSDDMICFVHTGGNLGFAGGSNVGLRFALADGYDLFWLLNNDTQVQSDSLVHLSRRMEEDPQIGMCGSTLVYATHPQMIQNFAGGRFNPLKGRAAALGFGKHVDEPVDRTEIEHSLTFVSGASMLVSRQLLERVGLMAEDYFLYFEESDWAERARGAFKLGYAPLSIVRHKVGASIGTDDFGKSSGLSTYYMSRNRVRFCWRYYRRALPFVYADLFREFLRSLLYRNWSRCIALLRATLNLSYRP